MLAILTSILLSAAVSLALSVAPAPTTESGPDYSDRYRQPGALQPRPLNDETVGGFTSPPSRHTALRLALCRL
jgi:hypothetical protein